MKTYSRPASTGARAAGPAYELQSQWSEVARLLPPYEERTRTASLPAMVQQLLYLRLASLHTEQGEWPKAIHFARQALHLAQLADDTRIQGEAHQALGKAYRLLGRIRAATFSSGAQSASVDRRARADTSVRCIACDYFVYCDYAFALQCEKKESRERNSWR